MTESERPGPLRTLRRRLRLAVVPTPRGVGVAMTAGLLYAAAVLIDTTTLLALAAVAAFTFCVALFVMLAAPRAMTLRRHVPAVRVRAGSPVRVLYELAVRTPSLLPVPRVTETVRLRHGPVERLTLSGNVANRRIAVDLPVLPRGVHLLGPTMVTRTDPLGLFEHRYSFPTADELVVWPTTTAVYAALAAAGLDGRESVTTVPASSGYDFRGLREFVPGDDKRRIHWASSAKRQTLLVRETHPDTIETASVVLDARRESYFPDEAGATGFELAVTAAASTVEVLVAIGWNVRLVLCMPTVPVLEVDTPKLLGAAMDRLAAAEPVAEGEAGSAVYEMVTAVKSGPSGPLIFCGGLCDSPLSSALSGPLSRRRRQLLVLCEEHRAALARGSVNPLLAGLSRPNRSIATPAGLEDLAQTWFAATQAGHRTGRPPRLERSTSGPERTR